MKYIVKLGFGQVQNNFKQTNNNIKWDQFNYPPCLNLFHFRPSEHQEKQDQVLAYLMASTHWCVIVVTILNLIGNSIQVAQGQYWPRILLSIFFLFIMNPLACFNFYFMYKIYFGEDGKVVVLYVLHHFLYGVYWLYMVSGFGNCNGFTRADYLLNVAKIKAAGALSIIQSILLIYLIVLPIYLTYRMCTR